MALPVVLAALGAVEAVSGAIVFVEFIKEESIQNVMMAASQAVRFNQKAKAKELYQKVRDVYALDLAKTVATPSEFDQDLVTWAGWTPWMAWDTGSPEDDLWAWGSLAPYSKPAFIAFVNSTLLSCKTNLDIL